MIYIAYPYGCKTINDVTINVEGLAVGNTLDDFSISYPENEGYALDFSSSVESPYKYPIKEYDPNTSSYTNFNGTFKEGCSYAIDFSLLPRERFIFADDMTINANIHSYQTTEFINRIYAGEAFITWILGPLCDHDTGNTYQKDSNKHWQQCSKCDQVITAKENHIYDDYRDETCNVCNYKRKITLPDVNVSYRTHVQTYGWEGTADNINTWKKNGAMSGTSGEAKRLEAICINLTGDMAKKYDVYYRVHAQSYGWLGWAKNGAPAGTAGYAKRLEGIQIILVEKGSTPPETVCGITSNNKEAYIEQ